MSRVGRVRRRRRPSAANASSRSDPSSSSAASSAVSTGTGANAASIAVELLGLDLLPTLEPRVDDLGRAATGSRSPRRRGSRTATRYVYVRRASATTMRSALTTSRALVTEPSVSSSRTPSRRGVEVAHRVEDPVAGERHVHDARQERADRAR